MEPHRTRTAWAFLWRGFTAAAILAATASLVSAGDSGEMATPSATRQTISWTPQVEHAGGTLVISGPGGFVDRQEFAAGQEPSFLAAEGVPDGTYRFELELSPKLSAETRKLLESARAAGNDKAVTDDLRGRGVLPAGARTVTGSFSIRDGLIILPPVAETGDRDGAAKDVLHYDDVIITGSLCVGFDCVSGESFGFDTVRLKEHNLRIHFDDTSYTASYPRNDWRIVVNDSTNGGASYWSVEDSTDGRRLFTLEAGASANSLYVEDYGRVGLGTSTPVVELHIKDSDTPTMRLEQDSSGGWTPQTWDVAGNESNFFVRDATNGSKLPFRIQPSAPSSSLCIKADGKVGIGTWSPGWPLEVETTNTNAVVIAERTDGSRCYMNATTGYGNFGTASNHPLRLAVNSDWKMRLDTDNSLTMRNGATCTSTGVWTDLSSREFKTNIRSLSTQEAAAALNGLDPVRFNYKADLDEEYLGFIAEEVPDLVATADRKGMSSMDVVAVLTKVVQEQQRAIAALEEINARLEERLAAVEARIE